MKKGVMRGFFLVLVGYGGGSGRNIRQGGHADRPQIKRFHVFVTGIETMEGQPQEDQTHDKI